MKCCSEPRLLLVLALAGALAAAPARGGTELALHRSIAGQVDVAGTGGSLRTAPDGTAPCAVGPSDAADLIGIPGGARIEAAYLHWAGSWSPLAGSTRTTPDWQVALDGQSITATRTFTETVVLGGEDLDFFGGFADVTALVAAKGNGSYVFSGLAVNDGYPHCAAGAVVAGWSLVVVYEQSSAPVQVIDIFDGFRACRGDGAVVTARNFLAPDTGVTARAAAVAWEGDENESAGLGGSAERFTCNGVELVDAANPAGNVFNSTVTAGGRTGTWGADFDLYEASALVAPADTTAVLGVASGEDMVLLAMVVFAAASRPVADLELTVTSPGEFEVATDGELVLDVRNLGPSSLDTDAAVTVVLPPGLVYVGADGGGWWTVDATGTPVITATVGRALPPGHSAAPLRITVRPDGSVLGDVVVTAVVTSSTFDNHPANNTLAATVTIVAARTALAARKTLATVADPFNGTANPKAIPGAFVQYSVEVSNRQADRIDRDSVVFTDAVPPGTILSVADLPGGIGPVLFAQGAVASGLTYTFVDLADPADDLQFSADGGASWDYAPIPDANGCDAAITHLRVTPQGRMRAVTRQGPASFVVSFRVRVE